MSDARPPEGAFGSCLMKGSGLASRTRYQRSPLGLW
jgi:hypothetical protein